MLTTQVTVEAAAWPVEVTAVDTSTVPPTETTYIVPPNRKHEFSVWQGHYLMIKEPRDGNEG